MWRLPLSAPQSRGKALVNLLPIEPGERITTIMPLPEDEASWESLDVMFATTRGTVRRNKLRDFAQVNRAGKIAMKLDEGENIVDVQICSEKDDVLLTTAKGQCIRFAVDDVRVFKGRNSMGVRGVSLADGDSVISLAILSAVRRDQRGARRLSQDAPRHGGRDRRGAERRRGRGRGRGGAERRRRAVARALRADVGGRADDPHRLRERLRQAHLVVRVPRRPDAAARASSRWRSTPRNGSLVASFPVEEGDEIMLVTDGGQLIRVPVGGIRVAGRATQGVIVFDTAEKERVVSVERITEPDGEDEEPSEAGD